jgi:hypothetical protein
VKRDLEVLRMMRERAKGRTQEQAAARAGMSVRTARTYERLGQLPSCECRDKMSSRGRDHRGMKTASCHLRRVPAQDVFTAIGMGQQRGSQLVCRELGAGLTDIFGLVKRHTRPRTGCWLLASLWPRFRPQTGDCQKHRQHTDDNRGTPAELVVGVTFLFSRVADCVGCICSFRSIKRHAIDRSCQCIRSCVRGRKRMLAPLRWSCGASWARRKETPARSARAKFARCRNAPSRLVARQVDRPTDERYLVDIDVVQVQAVEARAVAGVRHEAGSRHINCRGRASARSDERRANPGSSRLLTWARLGLPVRQRGRIR